MRLPAQGPNKSDALRAYSPGFSLTEGRGEGLSTLPTSPPARLHPVSWSSMGCLVHQALPSLCVLFHNFPKFCQRLVVGKTDGIAEGTGAAERNGISGQHRRFYPERSSWARRGTAPPRVLRCGSGKSRCGQSQYSCVPDDDNITECCGLMQLAPTSKVSLERKRERGGPPV